MITVTRTPATESGIYAYRLRADGVLMATRYTSHRFPLALVTQDGQHMLLIPQSQAKRADPSRLLVTVTEPPVCSYHVRYPSAGTGHPACKCV